MEGELYDDAAAAEHYWEPQAEPHDFPEMPLPDVTGLESDLTPAADHLASEDFTIKNPLPTPAELAERAGVVGTVLTVGAVAANLAYKARNRKAG
jgi:hypothetical protein